MYSLSFHNGSILGCFSGDKNSSLNNKNLYIYESKEKSDGPQIFNTDKIQLISSYIQTIPKLSYEERHTLTKSIFTNNVPKSSKLQQYFYESANKLIEIQKKELIIHNDDNSIFSIIPNPDIHNMITVFGQSSSGKSYWISQYLKAFRNIKTKIPIYLISRVDEDKAFDIGFEPKIIRVAIDDSIIETPIETIDFPYGSIIVCDDYATIANEKRRKAIKEFVNKCTETGRHHAITLICVFHKALSGRDTVALHSESTMAVLFPRANKTESDKYLTNYCSFTKNQLGLVKNMAEKSRWVAITKTYPNILMSEKEIIIL